MMSEKNPINPWCIFTPANGEGFLIGEIIYSSDQTEYCNVQVKKTTYQIPLENIIAMHSNAVILTQRLAQAQAYEKFVRPFWQSALEQAKRFEIMMQNRTQAICRGE